MHWQLNEEHSNTEIEMWDGEFNRIPPEFEVRYCKDPYLMTFERPLNNDQASVADGSEYRAVLVTAENFCCVHHKEFEEIMVLSDNSRSSVEENADKKI